MSESTTEAAPRRRPVLEVCLERATQTTNALAQVSAQYQYIKQAGAGETAPANVGLVLVVGEVQIPMTLPADAEKRQEYLGEAADFLGTEIVRLWGELKQATDEACQHCEASVARARAQEQEGGK